MNKEPKLNDSGERRTFASGAQRDRGTLKPRPDLISPHAQMREGMIFALGAQKYDTRNWEKGMPISECLASAQRHIEQWKRGDIDEDHLAQARWNLGAILHYEEEIMAGRMDPAIDDMPRYATPQPGDRRTNSETGQPEVYAKVEPGGDRHINPGYIPPTSKTYGIVIQPQPQKSLPAPPEKTVYIAGPMRGYTHSNFPAFDGARDLGESLGWKVISPADLDRAEGLDPSKNPGIVNEAGLSPTGLRGFANRDLNALLGLRAEDGDAIALLPYWQGSRGARMEHAAAVFLGLAILDATTFEPFGVEDY